MDKAADVKVCWGSHISPARSPPFQFPFRLYCISRSLSWHPRAPTHSSDVLNHQPVIEDFCPRAPGHPSDQTGDRAYQPAVLKFWNSLLLAFPSHVGSIAEDLLLQADWCRRADVNRQSFCCILTVLCCSFVSSSIFNGACPAFMLCLSTFNSSSRSSSGPAALIDDEMPFQSFYFWFLAAFCQFYLRKVL